MEDRLLNSSLVQRHHFRRDFIKRSLENHRQGRRDEGMQLWSLLNLTLWYDHWIEGKVL